MSQPEQRGQLTQELLDALAEARAVVLQRWSFSTGRKIRSLAVGQEGTAADQRILVGSEDGAAYLLNGNGKLMWKHDTAAWVLGVAFSDYKGDGQPAVIVGSDRLYVLELGGRLIDALDCDSHITSVCVGKLHGRETVITGHDNGELRAYDLQSGSSWSARCPKRIIALECCDVDLDGNIEIAAASEDKNVYLFGEDGSLRDRFTSNHWILSLAVGDIYGDGILRLLIASFEGDVYVYGGGKTAALRVNRRGILGITIGNLLGSWRGKQIVVGSSDRRLTVFDPDGRELWELSTSYGHRDVCILESPTGAEPSLLVGAEDGMVHCYSLRIKDGLRERIVVAAKQLGNREVRTAVADPRMRSVLMDLVQFAEDVRPAHQVRVLEYADSGALEESAAELLEIWKSGVEEEWAFPTGGRIYDLAVTNLLDPAKTLILTGSEDGRAYALDAANGEEIWTFKALGPVRGVAVIEEDPSLGPGAVVGSTDGCVYRLDAGGRPIWHVQSRDWILYVEGLSNPSDGNEPIVSYGSDGHYVEAVDSWGRTKWRVSTGDRVRALATGDVDGNGQKALLAGSDDRHVYVIDTLSGAVKSRFITPHWVLVITAFDIDGDGRDEILVGTEDGNLYVFDADGELRWDFKTGHWVAALDVCPSAGWTECQIIVGSADCYLYGLSAQGELNWKWKTDARVRTVRYCGVNEQGAAWIAYGSYDNYVRMVRLVSADDCAALAKRVMTATQRQNAALPRERLTECRLAMLGLVTRDHGGVWEAFDASRSSTARALSALLLLAGPDPINQVQSTRIADFIARKASTDEYLAIIRTLRFWGGNADAVTAVANAMLEARDHGASWNRAGELLRVVST